MEKVKKYFFKLKNFLIFFSDTISYQLIINENYTNNIDQDKKNKDFLENFNNNNIYDKVTLVNKDIVNKAQRNHFENNLNINNTNNLQNQEYMEEDKKDNYPSNTKNYIINSSNKNTGNNFFSGQNTNPYSMRESNQYNQNSPCFNNSVKSDNNENLQQFNVTFKNRRDINTIPNSRSLNFINQENDTNNTGEVQNQMQNKLDFFKKERLNFEKGKNDFEKILSEKCDEIKKINDSLEKNNQDFIKLNSKHNGILLYASDLQKKVEKLEVEILEKKEEISKFNTTDWGKLLNERDRVIKILQNDILYYKTEVGKIKSFLGVNDNTNFPHDLAKRVDNLVENYLTENKKFKKIVKLFFLNL